MKTAAIYARVSSDKQKEENTIASQTAALTAFLARLRSSAETLDIIERQRVVRLLVKEILVSDDKIVIRHSIPLPTGPSGSHDPSPIGGYSSSASGKSYLLRTGSNHAPLRGSTSSLDSITAPWAPSTIARRRAAPTCTSYTLLSG